MRSRAKGAWLLGSRKGLHIDMLEKISTETRQDRPTKLGMIHAKALVRVERVVRERSTRYTIGIVHERTAKAA